MICASHDPLDHEARITEVLLAYFEDNSSWRRNGWAPLLDDYPELASELSQFFADRELLDGILDPLRTSLVLNEADCREISKFRDRFEK